MTAHEGDEKGQVKAPIKFKNVEGEKMIVYNFDEMLSLLDHGWEVKEEHADGFFLMVKKDSRLCGGPGG